MRLFTIHYVTTGSDSLQMQKINAKNKLEAINTLINYMLGQTDHLKEITNIKDWGEER